MSRVRYFIYSYCFVVSVIDCHVSKVDLLAIELIDWLIEWVSEWVSEGLPVASHNDALSTF